MPIPALDLALLRGLDHIVRPRLNIFPPVVVGSRLVTVTPTFYPIGEIMMSGTIPGAKPGMMFRITEPSGETVTHGVVRKGFDGTSKLYIDGKSRGDTGQARRLLRAIAEGQTVTVYSYQPLWSLLSRIYQGIFYKKFDVPYVNEGSRPDPVCNIGDWRQADADPITGRATFLFNNNNSYTWLSDSQIISYQWTVPAQAQYIDGNQFTGTIEISLPPGFYTIYCKITDNFGKSHETMRPIWVNHPTLYPAISDKYGFEINSDQQDRTGRTIGFRIFGDFSENIIMPGGAVLFTCDDIYDGGRRLSDGVSVNNFVGFLSQETPRLELVNGQKSIQFEAKSPFRRMADLPMVSQAIVEKSAPINWTEIALGLGHVDFVGWYILKHHTTFMEMFDYIGLRETLPPRKKNWGLNGTTVSEYLEQLGKMIGGNIGSTSSGKIVIRRDPNIEESDYRDALDERLTWTQEDVVEPIEITRNVLPTVGQLRAFAFAYGTGQEPIAVAAMAPGFVQGQGPSKQDEESILVGDPLTAQDKINRVAGHMYAKANNPEPEVQIRPNRNMDVVDPALMLWHRLDFSEPYNPRDVRFFTRALPKDVDRGWENLGGVWLKRLTVTFETETFGQPGETYEVDSGGGSVYPPFEPPYNQPGPDGGSPEDVPSDGNGPAETGLVNLKGNFKFIVTWDSAGQLGINLNGTNWRILWDGSEGFITDVAPDWNSPYVRSGFVEGKMGIYTTVLDTSDTMPNTLHVYYLSNIVTPNVPWQRIATFTGTYSSVNQVGLSDSARILTYSDDPDHILVVYWDQSGTKYGYSLNAGVTWSESAGISLGGSDGYNTNPSIGAAVDADGTLVTSGVTGFDGDLPVYEMIRVPKGGGWVSQAVVDDSPLSNIPFPMIELDKSGSKGYCSVGDRTSGGANVYQYGFGQDRLPAWETIPIIPMQGQMLEIEITPVDTGVPETVNFYGEETPPPPPQPIGSFTYQSTFALAFEGIVDVTNITLQPLWQFVQLVSFGQSDTLTATIDFQDDKGKIIKHYDLAQTINLSNDVPGNPDVVTPWQLSLTANGVKRIFFHLQHIYNPGEGKTNYYGIPLYTLGLSEGAIYESHVGLWYGWVNVGRIENDDPRLYSFTNYKNPAAEFTEITPDNIWAPLYHYGLSIDPVITSRATMVSYRDLGSDDRVWFTTTNTGAVWTARNFTDWIGVRRVSNAGIFFGEGKLDITTNGGTSIASIIGDWAQVMPSGSVRTFRGALSAATMY